MQITRKTFGKLYYTQDQVNDFCIRANRAGLQIAMHAIGDAAVEQAVNAFEAALKDTPRADHRHVLIHCCLCTLEQLNQIASMKISIALRRLRSSSGDRSRMFT